MSATSYREGDQIVIDETTWVVRNVYAPKNAKRSGIGLRDFANPNHGTAFFSDVLDRMIEEGRAKRITVQGDVRDEFHAAAALLRKSETVAVEVDTDRGRELWPVNAAPLAVMMERCAELLGRFAEEGLYPFPQLEFARSLKTAVEQAQKS